MIKLAQAGIGVKQIGREDILVLTVFTEESQHEFLIANHFNYKEFAEKMNTALLTAGGQTKAPRPVLLEAKGGLPNGSRRPES